MKHRPQGIEVGGRPGGLIVEQLRSQVGQRSAELELLEGFAGRARGQPEVHQNQPVTQLGSLANEQVGGLDVTMDQAEIVDETQGPEGLDRESDQAGRAFVGHGIDDRAPIDPLLAEARPRGARVHVQFVSLGQSRVPQRVQQPELAPQTGCRLRTLGLLRRHQFLERDR